MLNNYLLKLQKLIQYYPIHKKELSMITQCHFSTAQIDLRKIIQKKIKILITNNMLGLTHNSIQITIISNKCHNIIRISQNNLISVKISLNNLMNFHLKAFIKSSLEISLSKWLKRFFQMLLKILKISNNIFNLVIKYNTT